MSKKYAIIGAAIASAGAGFVLCLRVAYYSLTLYHGQDLVTQIRVGIGLFCLSIGLFVIGAFMSE